MDINVLVPVADGTEELEAVAIVDILRRAGAKVTIASVSNALFVKCARGITLAADCLIADCLDQAYDLVALPGGIPGAEHLRDAKDLIQILKRQSAQGKLYGAICASPAVVLAAHGLLNNKMATCHPSFADQLPTRATASAKVISDGNCITSRGAGTAVEFALTLVEKLLGNQKRREVAAGLAIEG